MSGVQRESCSCKLSLRRTEPDWFVQRKLDVCAEIRDANAPSSVPSSVAEYRKPSESNVTLPWIVEPSPTSLPLSCAVMQFAWIVPVRFGLRLPLP